VTTEGQNRLGLAELCEQFANDQWLPTHVLAHEAVGLVLDLFKRTVAGKENQTGLIGGDA
jgi:hypothetical protein